jgi:predicted ATPase
VSKTRLALAVAHALAPAFADGAALVSLAAVRDPALVAPTLAIAEGGDRPPMERLKIYLRDRELLLVVDNFEQVLDAAPLLMELLGPVRTRPCWRRAARPCACRASTSTRLPRSASPAAAPG